MEKRKAHYDLSKIKKLLQNELTTIITESSQEDALALGYGSVEEIIEVVKRLCNENIYKSMTSNISHKIWQDVYKICDRDISLYIKLQLSVDSDKAIIISFKEDEGD